MRIGILTRRAGFNMGSSLQAYALAKFISDAGYSCRIIDYDEYSGHPLWKVRPFVENIQWNLLKHLPFRSNKYSYLLARAQQYRHFKEFEDKYLPLTRKTYRNQKQLATLEQEFDAFVCGSDQIWSPLLYDPVYYFNFLPKGCGARTVAYAPSIGVGNASLMRKEQIKLMQNVDCLSCRERQGAEIIERLTGREVTVVLDPTLMIKTSDWEVMANPVPSLAEQCYVLCYFLGDNVHQSYVNRLRKEQNCKVVNIQMFNRLNNLNADYQMSDIGPIDFLGLIKNAAWVCTDSFHAIIFSYIFQRRISIFERFKTSDKNSQNSRIYTLLEILGIQDSLVRTNESADVNRQTTNCTESKLLDECRVRSLEYLNNALNKL